MHDSTVLISKMILTRGCEAQNMTEGMPPCIHPQQHFHVLLSTICERLQACPSGRGICSRSSRHTITTCTCMCIFCNVLNLSSDLNYLTATFLTTYNTLVSKFENNLKENTLPQRHKNWQHTKDGMSCLRK